MRLISCSIFIWVRIRRFSSDLFPLLRIANYYLWLVYMLVYVVSEATRSSLWGHKVQTLRGGVGSIPSVWICYCMQWISPFWGKILYKALWLQNLFSIMNICRWVILNFLHTILWHCTNINFYIVCRVSLMGCVPEPSMTIKQVRKITTTWRTFLLNKSFTNV